MIAPELQVKDALAPANVTAGNEGPAQSVAIAGTAGSYRVVTYSVVSYVEGLHLVVLHEPVSHAVLRELLREMAAQYSERWRS
jgi:hypothetical protein